MIPKTRNQLIGEYEVCVYQIMKALGKDVQMICLDGAYHGFGGFRSDEALDLVYRFIREKLGL